MLVNVKNFPSSFIFFKHPDYLKFNFMLTQDAIFWIINNAAAFVISTIVAAILIPKIILIAFRRRLFDEQSERKVHKGIVPRLGGLSFFPSYLLALSVLTAVNLRLGWSPMIVSLSQFTTVIYFLISSILLLYLTGITDDLVGVKYRAKFIMQILAALLLIASGMYIDNFHGILWMHQLPDWFGYLFSAFVIVFVVNAINLIDGIDGLASGLSMIGLGFYGVVLFNGAQYIYAMIAFAVVGTLLPFFYYNVFGDAKKQKKIFMGDTGSMTTGMVLVFCALCMMRAKPATLETDYNPAIVSISPLIVPCFDVCRVYFHRVRRGRNPFLPDKAHIHHKLLALGMNQTNALLSILAVSLAFTGVNVLLSPYINPNLIILGDIIIWTIGNIMLTSAIRRRETRLNRKLFD